MTKTIRFLYALPLAICLVFSACGVKGDSEPEDPAVVGGFPEFVLLEDAGNRADTIDLQVEGWTATADADWVKLKQEGTKLIVSAAMWIDSPKGTKEQVQERETEIRETKVSVKLADETKVFTAKQENIYVGKFAQGGIIYWLNTGDNKIAEGYPDCKGLVLSLEESPFLRPFFVYNVSDKEKEGKKSRWLYKKCIELIKTNGEGINTPDGLKSTEKLLSVCDKFLREEGGILPLLEEYGDWNFPETLKKNPQIYYCPNYVWFKNRYWQKSINGYSDWYIATRDEIFPMFKWEEFLFMDIKALILTQWESGLQYDDIEIIPIDSKFKKKANSSEGSIGLFTFQENYLVTTLSSINSYETGTGAARFIDFKNSETGQYSAFDNLEKFNEFINSGAFLNFKSVVRPIRRF